MYAVSYTHLDVYKRQAVLIALIGTWFPARRIARLYPVEVLYGR